MSGGSWRFTKFCQYIIPCWNFLSTGYWFQLIRSIFGLAVHPAPTCTIARYQSCPGTLWIQFDTNRIKQVHQVCTGPRQLASFQRNGPKPQDQDFDILFCYQWKHSLFMMSLYVDIICSSLILVQHSIPSASVVSTLTRHSSGVLWGFPISESHLRRHRVQD